MAYSKTDAAKALGISKKELEDRAKSAGFHATEDYWNSIGGAAAPIIEKITNEIIAIDRQLDEMAGPLSLTDEEKNAFLQKAIDEVTPYFEKKRAELEAGLEEGRVRTAEDILDTIRDVELDTNQLLAKYDLSTAQTEEEFVERMGALTSNTENEILQKTDDWRQRLEGLKFNQIRRGVFTSGFAKKERAQQQARKELELQNIQQRSQQQAQALETGKKYDLEQIQLAREAARNRRISTIGTPEERQRTEEEALGTLGYGNISQLPSDIEIERQRTERGVSPIYNKNVLDDLSEERRKAELSRAGELESDELAIRDAAYDRQREKILAQRASKARSLASYGRYV